MLARLDSSKKKIEIYLIHENKVIKNKELNWELNRLYGDPE